MDKKLFPSIEGFHNVIKTAEYFGTKTVKYRGKMKQHGTNAGVRICNGEVAFQSHSAFITPENDNAGFARWGTAHIDYWKSLSIPEKDITVYGEWCGPGIQKGTAIQQIAHKIFAVFAIRQDDIIIYEPTEIETFLKNRPLDVHILPWQTETLIVDYSNRENMQSVADSLNKLIEELEPSDPWVKSVFGATGIAEGVVFYPGIGEVLPYSTFENFTFKAKGKKHQSNNTKEAVQVDPEVVANINQFVSIFITESRCEQGLATLVNPDMKQTGAFLKWVCSDVEKESKAELEASGLEWKDVNKAVQISARKWFMDRMTKI